MKTCFYLYIAIFTALVLTVSAFAQTADPPSGSGTLSDPYLIATLNNLYWITQNSGEWGKGYKQTADIDATTDSTWDGKQGFTPIGNDTTNFTGSYDGQTYKITGLYINRTMATYLGLFGWVSSATITNIKLEGVNILYCSGSVGGLIGCQVGGTVTNCYSTGFIDGGYKSDVGGLIGYQSNSATVSGCYSTSSVTGSYANCGGLIGYQENSTAINCYSTGSVSGYEWSIGGLIGLQDGGTVANCYSSGNIEGSMSCVGGLIGEQYYSTVSNCYSTKTVEGNLFLGGLIGWQRSCTITNCYSTGSVLVLIGTAGGLIGESIGGTVSNCYSAGDIWGGMSTGVGGLIGEQDSGTVSNCYSTGYVKGGVFIGGLIGNRKSGIARNCFWDMQTSNQINSAGGTGENTIAMKTQSTFFDASWDFTIWNMEVGRNNGYPYLKWQNLKGNLLFVELTFFSVSTTHSGATLKWKTATEVNNAGFEIERRGISNELPRQEANEQAVTNNWEKVGFVSGFGMSNAPKEYSYFDAILASGRYAYRLKQVNQSGTFKYSQSSEIEVELVPKELTLAQNYPNPFNPSTTMEFTVPENGRASLKIYNTIGQLVATAFDGDVNAGNIQKVTFTASHLSSGVYFSRLEYNGKALLKKLVLMK